MVNCGKLTGMFAFIGFPGPCSVGKSILKWEPINQYGLCNGTSIIPYLPAIVCRQWFFINDVNVIYLHHDKGKYQTDFPFGNFTQLTCIYTKVVFHENFSEDGVCLYCGDGTCEEPRFQ